MSAIWDYNTTQLDTTITQIATDYLTQHNYTIDEVVIFGSYGRDDATPDSDLDILLVVEHNTTADTPSDTERKSIFHNTATYCEKHLKSELPPELLPADILVGRWFERDKMLVDVTEHYTPDTTKDWPCLAYSLSKDKKITVLHP